ncbi:MAG: serine hydrolase domain-containing protein [Actinomycetota bacterium]
MLEPIATDLDFSAVRQRMQWYIDEHLIPFCTMVVLKGTDVIEATHLGGGTPETTVDDRSIFRMHSSTKLATSVAAMMLHEEGRFGLDDPLEQYLPAFADMRVLTPDATSADDTMAARSPILVRHILSHSAGLSYGFIEPDSVIDKAYNAAGLDLMRFYRLTLAELVERLGELPLAYEPGTSWRYSYATDVTARLVEVLSGRRFDEFLSERLLEPLGMVDTDFWVPAAKRDRLTTMFLPADPTVPMTPGLSPMALEPEADGPPAMLSGGGGLFSTVVDYVEFMRMLVNGGEWRGRRYLEPETLTLMRSNQLAPGVGVRFPMWSMRHTTFGLGFALKEGPDADEPNSAVGEYHWGGMAGTHFWLAPEPDIVGICMTQRMPGFWHPFSRDFKRLVYEIAG